MANTNSTPKFHSQSVAISAKRLQSEDNDINRTANAV